ncbi:MAG: DUF2066 domain-containing protein [Hyphomicrobiaceae bacterium]
MTNLSAGSPISWRALPIARADTAIAAALMAAAALMLPQPVSAQRAGGNVYTIANYPVEATAANAVAAKEQAIAEGRKAAFRSLLKRIVPVTSYPRLKALAEVPIAPLFDGFAVRSERNSTTSYIASLDFTFRADAVRALLRRDGVPFVDDKAGEVVLIAAVREAGKLVREGAAAESWSGIWRDLDTAHTITPLRIDAVKPVIHNDTLQMLVTGDDSAIRVFASEYGAEAVLTAIAEVDRPAGRLNVILAGRDGAGVFNLRRAYRLVDGDVPYTMELAAVISLGIIEGRWKAQKTRYLGSDTAVGGGAYGDTPSGAGAGVSVQIEAEFAGLSEWNRMREALETTPGVGGIAVAAVSARGADLALSYPGGGEALANALAARGLSLTDLGGVWLLKNRY